MPTKIEAKVEEAVQEAKEATRERCRMKEVGDTLLMDAVTHFETWQELAEFYKVDLDIWQPKSITTNSWQVGSKDPVGKGFIVQPLMQIKVIFEKRKAVAMSKDVMEDLMADMKSNLPVLDYPEPVKKASRKAPKKSRLTLEISLPDPHYGLLAWGEESGMDWDAKLCAKAYMTAVRDIINKASSFDIEKIVYVTGNDFFNVNSMLNTTAKGTPQDEDGRYRKTFKEGRELQAKAINTCREVAPVDVVIVPGNHDEERSFYLGDALECLYMNDKHVNVDNGPAEHKILQIYKSMICVTHGDKTSARVLPMLMATSWPMVWAKSLYRCAQQGHLHTDKVVTFAPSAVQDGVHVRWMPSLAPSSSWAAGKGYIPYRMGLGIVWGQKGPEAELIHRP